MTFLASIPIQNLTVSGLPPIKEIPVRLQRGWKKGEESKTV